MATEILLPQLGFSMTEEMLAEWLVADGAEVSAGQMIYALETDKATQELESPATGTLKILAAAGEVYEVGAVLGTIG